MEKEYLIRTWLNNELSEAEVESFEAMDDAQLCEEIIQEAQRFKGDEQAKVSSFSELDELLTTKKKVTTIHWMNTAYRIAAVFVIGLGIFALIDKSQINTFETGYAQNETIKLPDNSVVNLNQLSQLEYDKSQWEEKRELKLSGEAYFDVEKGKRFFVKTNQGIVSVLGTRFNVISRDDIFIVSCYKGLVQVNYNNEEIRLPAGTEFMLKSASAKKTDIIIAEPYWLKDMSVFENAAIQDVLNELEKQYNVTVSYNSDIKLYFTGAFEHNNLENALKSITEPLNLIFDMTSKEKVIIRNANKD